jgi:hypothetical protein
MSDILENWTHPESKQSLADLVAVLPDGQDALPVEDGWNE